MKILQLITQSNDIGGASIHLIDLTQKLKQDGHEVIVAAGGSGVLKTKIENNGIKYIPLAHLKRDINLRKDFKAVIEIYKLIKQKKPDIVCLHSSKAGLVGRISSYFTNIPNTFTVHGWAFTDGKSNYVKLFYKVIEKIAGVLSGQVICVSNFDYKLALKESVVNKKKLNVVQNGIFQESIEKTDIDNDVVKLIMVARFEAQKNHELLLKALSNLKDKRWQLTLVGGGSNLSRMKNLAESLEIDDKVCFLGFRDDVKDLLSQADVFVLTSNYEGLPITILEAMRAKLPVVASDVGGVSEQVEDGKTGYLIKNNDINKLVTSLDELILKKELREDMGYNGYNLFKEKFTFEDMYQKTLDVYKRAVN